MQVLFVISIIKFLVNMQSAQICCVFGAALPAHSRTRLSISILDKNRLFPQRSVFEDIIKVTAQ